MEQYLQGLQQENQALKREVALIQQKQQQAQVVEENMGDVGALPFIHRFETSLNSDVQRGDASTSTLVLSEIFFNQEESNDAKLA